jgi:hypothetical protein
MAAQSLAYAQWAGKVLLKPLQETAIFAAIDKARRHADR